MLPLIRAGILEKDWLGVGLLGNASFPSLKRYILKFLPLSGPTLTWQTGALSLTPSSLFHLGPNLSLQNQIPHSLPLGSFQAINFMLPILFFYSAA